MDGGQCAAGSTVHRSMAASDDRLVQYDCEELVVGYAIIPFKAAECPAEVQHHPFSPPATVLC